jgi:hypothetical protein
MTLGNVFKTLHFLRNIRMGPTRKSVTIHRARKDCCRQKPKLIEPVHKLQRKLIVANMTLGTVITTLKFIRNLQMGPTRKSVTIHGARKDCHRQTPKLIESVHKLQRKMNFCEYNSRILNIFPEHSLLTIP